MKEKFGMHSTVNELFSRSDMVIISLDLVSPNLKNLNKNVEFLCDLQVSIKDVLDAASKYFMDENNSYQIVDEKYVSIPPETLVKKLFIQRGGSNLLNFVLVNKFKTCFEILRPHEQSILVNNAPGNKGALQNTSEVRLNKDIRARLVAEKVTDNASKKMIENFPYLKTYVFMNKIEEKTHKRKSKKQSKLNFFGPVTFYAILFSLLFQISQIRIFSVHHMRSYHNNLLNVFLVSKDNKSVEDESDKIYYFKDISTSLDYKNWLNQAVTYIYQSKNPRTIANTFFNSKVKFLGPALLLLTQTKSYDCSGNRCFYTEYNSNTRSIFLLKRN